MPSSEIVIQKFGGAALMDVAAMSRVAQLVAATRASGRSPCVVVSAMGTTTDDLIGLARACGAHHDPRELDALLACGESTSAPLFALCLRQLGLRAVSLSAAQAGLASGPQHGEATITSVDASRVRALLADDQIPVVAGFQGVAPNGDLTTLGRGGSDLTAVALGCALGASLVELYKDVDGVYDRDPHTFSDARWLAEVDYDGMLAILEGGGHAVLQPRAVEYAKRHAITLRVLPFQGGGEGTRIVPPRGTRSRSERPSPAPTSRAPGDTSVFEAMESNVRGYCRSFPTVFTRAKGALQWDEAGKRYIDFFSGAGALNYGHNPDDIQARLVAYLTGDGVTHALDMYTQAKRSFLETFRDVILEPRSLDYKVQFCGPTGANAVEAALKLARLRTGRTNVASFTGGWHGMTAACLSVCGNREHRQAAGTPLPFTSILPYPVGPYQVSDALRYTEALFDDPNSGLDLPAAVILETVQAEGGIYVAPPEWLRGIRALCDRHGVLLIVDDIQVGCGRAGTFFSFEEAGIVPDLVCLSKSIGGYGLPMSLLLMRPDVDVWKPGQHTGTFRGHQLAFVAATAALEHWRRPAFVGGIASREAIVEVCLRQRIASLDPGVEVRGRGLIWGVDLTRAGGEAAAAKISQRAFDAGLIVERCGRGDTVLKIMPPLNIDLDVLEAGLEVLVQAARATLIKRPEVHATHACQVEA